MFSNSLLSWLIPLIGSLGAIGAAIAAWRATRQIRNSTLAQVVMQIADSYGSEEMLNGMIILRKWKDNCGPTFAEEFCIHRLKDRPKIEEEDKARRRYSHHFHKLKLLRDTKVVGKRFLKKIVSKDQVEFLLEVVEPLEKVIEVEGKKTYDSATFVFFRELLRKEMEGK